jgi:hypothetical protein
MLPDANEIKAFPSRVILRRRVCVTWMARGEGVFVRKAFRRSFKQSLGNLVHRFAVIVAREQVPVSVHRDLQRRVAGKSLHRLWGEACFNPA